MNVLITGATGLVGTRLSSLLTHNGHRVLRLRLSPASSRANAASRRPRGTPPQNEPVVDVRWLPGQELPETLAAQFAGELPALNAVVHLAGASIAGGRWTPQRKELLRSSRVDTTRRLVAALERLPVPPSRFLSASAVGYYGDRGEEVLTEESPPGSDFLAKLARDWESEALRAETWGAHVALMRFGIVLAREGGALAEMARPFRFGAGGKLGSGRQWMSWIAIEDAACAIHFLLEHIAVCGPVNLVSPEPITNADFTRELAKAMRRPGLLGAPRGALRLLLGREMADALLGSQRVVPRKLGEGGYQFLHPHLDAALHTILRG